MFKKRNLIIMVALIFAFFLYNNFDRESKIDSFNYHIKFNSLSSFKELTTKNILTNDLTHQYNKGSKTIARITVRKFNNGDKILFYRFDDNLEFELTGQSLKQSISFADYQIKKPHDKVIGVDKVSLPAGFYQNKINSFLISKVIYSKTKQSNYGNNNKTVLRDFIAEVNPKVDKHKIIIDGRKNQIAEGWIYLSKGQKLNQKIATEYINLINQEFYLSPWMTDSGCYYKIPWAAIPFTKNGYSRQVGPNSGKIELRQYQKTKNEFYHNLAINKLEGLTKMKRHKSGVWLTEYANNYIYKPYGIQANFVDTRYNEIVSLFLNDFYQYHNNLKLKELSLVYPKFILEQTKKGQKIIDKNDPSAYLVPDYYSDFEHKTSHSSLNHQLGIVNMMLKLYQKTKQTKYLDQALPMIKFIENTYRQWLREDGDTFYRMTSDYQYSQRDYKQVTLRDMLETNKLLTEIGFKKSKEIAIMIKSKYNYLIEQNVEIESDINQMLIKQGFKND